MRASIVLAALLLPGLLESTANAQAAAGAEAPTQEAPEAEGTGESDGAPTAPPEPGPAKAETSPAGTQDTPATAEAPGAAPPAPPGQPKPARSSSPSMGRVALTTREPMPPRGDASAAPADSPAPDRHEGPIQSRVAIALTLDTLFLTARSFDLFSSKDSTTNTGVYLGYAVIDGAISIEPQIGFSTGAEGRSGLFGGAITRTDLTEQKYYGGLDLRLALLPFLEPEARVAVGASTLDVSVDPSTGAHLSTHDTSPFATFGAGLTLRTPPGGLETRSGSLRKLAFGITLEGGYVAARSVELAPSPPHDTGRIPTADARLGVLERSGPYARLAALVRF